MKRPKVTTTSQRRPATRSAPALKDRRGFLANAGSCAALMVGGSYLGADATLESRPAQASEPTDAGREVKEKAKMVRIFGLARRAPGLTNAEVRGKSFISLLGYGSAGLREAMKSNDTRQPLLFIQNFVNDAAFGADGQTQCPPFNERDFVAEYFMGIGETVVGSVSGTIPPPPKDPELGAAPAKGRGPTLPEYGEAGTDLRLGTRQVFAHGNRPLAVTGREKAMYFITMSPTVPVGEHLKVWQALHEKALQANPLYANGLAGYEVMQRLPDTAVKMSNRCGTDMTVPDLVVCYWVKANNAAAQFPRYARTWRQADQQSAIDHPATFFLLVEEWEVFMNPTFIG